MSDGLYLEFVPEIALVFDRLQRDGYLREVDFADRNPEAIRFFTISDAGREKLREVSRWYGQLPWYLKLWGRIEGRRKKKERKRKERRKKKGERRGGLPLPDRGR